MVFERIEKLKQEYTDKFVTVDAFTEQRPELRRFKGLTGTVRTVNMSGKALVEFDGFANIGWYDIDIDYLSILDKPLPKPEAKAKPAKPAAKPAKKAAKKTASPAPGAAGKMSVEEMLAAARSGAGGATAKSTPQPSQPAAAASGKMSVEQMLAAARGEKGGGGSTAPAAKSAGEDPLEKKQKNVTAILESARTTTAQAAAPATPAGDRTEKIDPTKMSVEAMLAAARTEKGASPQAQPAAAEPAPAEPTVEETLADATPAAAATEPGGEVVSKKDEITDVQAMLDYCRKVDG